MARTNIVTFPLLILRTSATLATKTNAIVKISINTGTPRMNSMYVRDNVLAIRLFEIRPIPEIKPRKRAIINEAIVDRNVSLSPGRIKKKALLYSGSTMII